MPHYETVIGLEVHAQLLTKTKLFCGDSTEFGLEPNTQVSAISLAHPGTLPRMNGEAINLAITLGLACNCEIVKKNYFARKNYFYPDLPKGYQISQHTTPICRGGFLDIPGRIRLNRIHMEEDAGKSSHEANSKFTNLDFNRAGMPLIEIVTEPDIRSAEDAYLFVTKLRKLVRHLGVCDGNMEQGSLRCDVNISVRKHGEQQLGTKVEIKNLNSIRFIKKAIEFEQDRLISLLESGRTIMQETRGFNESDFTTYSIRVKEDEEDYRYFPEPDLPPFFISEDTIESIREQMPPLPEDIRKKLEGDYSLSNKEAALLGDDADLSKFFFEVAKHTENYKAAFNWITGPLRNHIMQNDISSAEAVISPVNIAILIRLVDEGKISYGVAVQQVFPEVLKTPQLDLLNFIEKNNLELRTDPDELEMWINAALDKHSQKISEFKKGKKGLISLFVGEVMRSSGGKADARIITEKIIEKINTR